jgi:hypothetical protein
VRGGERHWTVCERVCACLCAHAWGRGAARTLRMEGAATEGFDMCVRVRVCARVRSLATRGRGMQCHNKKQENVISSKANPNRCGTEGGKRKKGYMCT